MDITCPRCDTANKIPARICQKCGLSLTSRSKSAATSASGMNWSGVPASPPNPPVTPASKGVVKAQLVAIGQKTWWNAGAGFIGGLVASLILWALGVGPYSYSTTVFALMVGIVTGFCVPAALSAYPHVLMKRTNRAVQIGSKAGAVGALMMTIVALILARFATPLDVYFAGRYGIGLIVWAIFGVAIGVVEGLVWRSQRRAILGGIGGGIGGVLAFLIGYALNNEGTFVLVGLLLGAAAGLIQDIYKQAWIRILSGPHEGTEVIIDKDLLRLGSSDGPEVDLGLYQDPAIAARHMEVRRQNGTYTLTVLAGATPPLVNGKACQGSKKLSNGDRIQIGQTVLQFHARATQV